MMRKRAAWTVITGLLLIQGCTLQTIALRSIDGVFDNTVAAIMREGDLRFAESAIAGNLMILEGMAASDPGNVKFLFLACEGYTSYALVFADDDQARALSFYNRALEYGMRGLVLRGIPRSAFKGDAEGMNAALQRLDRGDVPLVFWTANAWGNAISLQLEDPDAIANLPAANAMMEWVQAWDPGYFYGGASLYFGVFYGSLPPALGGRPELARENFERAIAAGQGRFLLTYVLYAKTYAVEMQDEKLFQDLLDRVVNAPPDLLPEQRLANVSAVARARKLLARKADFF